MNTLRAIAFYTMWFGGFVMMAAYLTGVAAASPEYALFLRINGTTQQTEFRFDDLTDCRRAAHQFVQDPRPFDPQTHLFQSPSGASMAYCLPVQP